MLKTLSLFIFCILISSCASLEKKATRIKVGDSKTDVARIMGVAPYRITNENVDAWRYAVVAGFGYCDYREFYIYRNIVIYRNDYHHASIAGCTAGLKHINWEPVLAAAKDYDKANPIIENKKTEEDMVDKLTKLNKLKRDGALTEKEYKKAKKFIFDSL